MRRCENVQHGEEAIETLKGSRYMLATRRGKVGEGNLVIRLANRTRYSEEALTSGSCSFKTEITLANALSRSKRSYCRAR